MRKEVLITIIAVFFLLVLNADAMNGEPTGNIFKKILKKYSIQGSFNSADCNQIKGYTCFQAAPNLGLTVYLQEGTSVKATSTANQKYPATSLCSPNHGFTITTPATLKDGLKHSLSVYALDPVKKTKVLISGSPKSITCAVPTSQTIGTTTTLPPSCTNNVKDQDETDADCGGSICTRCSVTQTCVTNNDCIYSTCVNGVCTISSTCTTSSSICLETTSNNNCADGRDNDADNFIDCQDSGCSTASNCVSPQGCGMFCSTTTTTNPNGTVVGPTSCQSTALTCQNNKCYSSNCQESGSANNCNDNIDNDFDNTIDCSDTSCATANNCIESTTLIYSCKDNKDNNLNSFIDCADSGCSTYSGCQSPESSSNNNCADGTDNDGDGSVDCKDPLCGSATNCQENPGNNNCADGIDNDWDSGPTSPINLRDCADSGCYGSTVCQYEPTWLCQDNGDNDGDGLTDCKDPDCSNQCAEREYYCFDGKDNDNNGLTDALDPTCSFFIVEANGMGCTDYADNDNNGFIDCADQTCKTTPACGESGFSCYNGVDDDGDGIKDCSDIKCVNAGACGPTETLCADRRDNDADGRYDCTDTDCMNNQLCACSDSDGGYNGGQFGVTSIGGALPQSPYDYCDYLGVSTPTTTKLREASCNFAFSTGHTMYEIAPGSVLDCTTLGQGYTKCVNGRCV